MISGPCRMRKKMMRNDVFYQFYPFRDSEQGPNVSHHFKSPATRNVKFWWNLNEIFPEIWKQKIEIWIFLNFWKNSPSMYSLMLVHPFTHSFEITKFLTIFQSEKFWNFSSDLTLLKFRTFENSFFIYKTWKTLNFEFFFKI